MNPKRYDFGMVRNGGIGVPGMVETEGGKYMEARFYDAAVAHNEMLVERLKMADAKRTACDQEAVQLLRDLAGALGGAFISSWQSTAAWKSQLDAAMDYFDRVQP